MLRTATLPLPALSLVALSMFAVSCGGRSSDGNLPAATPAQVAKAEAAEKEQAVRDDNPFAAVPEYERPKRVIMPRTKAEQLRLVDDQAWRDAVEKAHQAELVFQGEAGRAFNSGNLTEELRNEIKRGKALLNEAIDATWQIEEDLKADPARSSVLAAVSKLRTDWLDRVRSIGKLVRG
ncbi:hypothetical protein Pla163_00350 [Planctomycetes bacterium Pla163]|uniref:Lipoprotein n=1 Tax=Rohdeia mirabilis TaxID=2528008 RepID=A0A518CUN2_9BACT|nr:hypothetical protein Pla163_00350 [Planctomycetes bacterium Pla163]